MYNLLPGWYDPPGPESVILRKTQKGWTLYRERCTKRTISTYGMIIWRWRILTGRSVRGCIFIVISHVNKKYVLQTLIFRPSLVKVRGRVKLRKFDSNSNSCSNSLLFALFQVKSGTCSLFVELPTDIRSYRIDILKVFSLTYQVTIQSHMLPTTVSLLWAFRAINVNVFKPC